MPARRPEHAIRAVVVGAGLMGRFHAAAVAAVGGTLAAVVDRELDRARALARGAPVAPSLAELAELAGGTVDVVHVCTPADTHVDVVGEALALGAHTIVEKPVAPDGDATAALLDAAGRHEAMLVPVHQFLFQPGIRRILAGRERLGALVRVQFEAATAGADAGVLGPDELVADILPHPLALFARLVDRPPSELEWLVQRPVAGELHALAETVGTVLEIVVSTRARPTRARLGVTGTRGSAEADLYHGFATFERGDVSRAWKAARPFARSAATLAAAGANLARRAGTRETAYPGLRELVRQTYEAIATGAAAPISTEETLAVARGRDAILRAAAAPAPARKPL